MSLSCSKPVKRWITDYGIECLVVLSRFELYCAYAKLPYPHPWWHIKETDDPLISSLDVHGGVTFVGTPECVADEEMGQRWIGIDFAHEGDFEFDSKWNTTWKDERNTTYEDDDEDDEDISLPDSAIEFKNIVPLDHAVRECERLAAYVHGARESKV